MALNQWSERTGEEMFGSSPLVVYLKTIFPPTSHSHSISDVTNLQSSLNAKQNTIPNLTVKTTQTIYGLTVTTYSDNLNVYLKISGTLNNSSDLPNGGNRSQIGTLQNTDYAPPSEMQTTVHSANAPNWSRMTVYSDGRIFFQNGASSKSYALECGFYYPLKSRIP